MKNIQFSFNVVRNEEDVSLTIEGTYVPRCKGATDGRYGPPIEPDEPAVIEIDSVLDEDGNEVELTEDESERAQEEGMRALADMEEGYEPDYDEERGKISYDYDNDF